jgi:hypothetical protein
MVRVTPISVIYTVTLLLAVFSLTLPTFKYYTNPQTYITLNDTYKNLNLNYTQSIYGQTNNAIFSSSSGLKASNGLQIFSGLAFMFGAMYQVVSDTVVGLPMIGTVLTTMAQYSPLPNVDIVGLISLMITASVLLLGWWAVASWTKVEG